MKNVTRFCAICLALFFTPFLFSQITITAADFQFATQDTILVYEAGSNGLLHPSIGINQSWDYSGLTSLSSRLIGVDPNVSTSALNTFSGADVFFTDTDEEQETYFSHGSQSLEKLGSWASYTPTPSSTIYQNPLTLYAFPMTYGSSFTDNANFVENYPPNHTISFNETITSEIIAWGNLTTPNEYYPHVLLQRNIIYRAELSSSGYGGQVNPLTIDTSYNFLSKDAYYPVLSLHFTQKSDSYGVVYQTQKTVEYLGGLVYMDTEEINRFEQGYFSVYPNPAIDVIEVVCLSTKASYSLVSMHGAILQSGWLTKDESSIQISRLPAGDYLLVITENEVKSVLKVVKQ